MPMSPAKIGLAVQGGLCVVCATCERYWAAQDRGRPHCGKDCGGPVSGRAFPKYKGPMRDMTRHCFVCGDTTMHVVHHPLRKLGVCEQHRTMVGTWCTNYGIGMERVVAEKVLKINTLGRAMYEVEKYYADKEGREF